MRETIKNFYNKHYKTMLFFPLIVILLSLVIIGHTYYTTGDFIHKDISLSGGTTITIFSNASSSALQTALAGHDAEVRALLDNSGKQTQLIVTTSEAPETISPAIESFLGYKLSQSNSSVEFTGSNLSQDFYKQLLIAVAIAFFWMSAVVFIIFSKGWKMKFWTIILNILFGIFLGKLFLTLPLVLSIIILIVFVIGIPIIYLRYSAPSFAVMLCAFADIIMTLAVVDLTGMKIAGAGIVAFLMLIGYSVDTDILLTTRVLRRKGTSVNHEIFSSFKTGMTMTLTAIAAVAVALFTVYKFETALNQIFTILLIGLFFDIFNTWITNTALIKWFAEKNQL